jgi:RecA-family ATPase
MPEDKGFTLTTAATVTIKPVKYVIQGRVPLAMLTVLAGRGGLGKSTLGVDWVAQVTIGKAAGALAGTPSHVIISSTEDTEAETIVPRLMAAHADMGKAHFIHLHRGGVDGSLTIPDDIDILRAAIQQTHAKMVIIDPLMSHLSATLNG